MSNGYIWIIEYASGSYCADKQTNSNSVSDTIVMQWSRLKPDCYVTMSGSMRISANGISSATGTAHSPPYSSSSGYEKGGARCMISSVYAANSSCSSSSFSSPSLSASSSSSSLPLTTIYTPYPSYCAAPTRCVSLLLPPFSKADTFVSTVCSASSCIAPPLTYTPVSLTISYYNSADCSGVAFPSLSFGACSRDSTTTNRAVLYVKGDGFVWQLLYDSAEYCATRSGTLLQYSRMNPGCNVIGGEGSIMIGYQEAPMTAGGVSVCVSVAYLRVLAVVLAFLLLA